MTTLGAFVITYNRPLILVETIKALLGQTRAPDLILIVDNGDSQKTAEVLAHLEFGQIVHLSMGDNLGPAAAEAFGLQWLCDRGYDWILWVDDDNPPVWPEVIERLLILAASDSAPESLAGVAAVGHRFDWRTGRVIRLDDSELTEAVEVDIVGGNSQLILRREAVQAVGGPDQQLFIDFEDSEYCLRLRRAGYRILVDGDLMRRHRERFGRLARNEKTTPTFRQDPGAMWRRYYFDNVTFGRNVRSVINYCE